MGQATTDGCYQGLVTLPARVHVLSVGFDCLGASDRTAVLPPICTNDGRWLASVQVDGG